MNRKRLGLTIDAQGVSAVLVRTGFRDSQVLGVVRIDLEPAENQEDPLQAALERVAAAFDLNEVDCAVAIPSGDFSFRNLTVPFSDERKIRQVLPYELEPLLPEAVDRLICDFMTIGPLGDKTAAVAGAIDRQSLEKLLARLEKVGIDPEAVLPAGVAAARQVAADGAVTGDVLVLYAAGGESTLLGLREGRLCLIRPFAVPAPSPEKEEQVARGLIRTCRALADTELSGFAPDRLVVVGSTGGLDLQALHGALPPLALEIRRRDPMPADAGALAGETDPNLLADAFSLAGPESVDGFNFRRGPLRFEPTLARRNRRLAWAAVLAILSAALFLGDLALENRRMDAAVTRIDRETVRVFRDAFPEVKNVQAPIQQMQQKIRETRSASGDWDGGGARHRVTDILDYLSRRIPQQMDVELVQLIIGEDQMTLGGSTDSYNTVNEMKNALSRGAFFSRVEISTATVNRKDGRIQFSLKVDL